MWRPAPGRPPPWSRRALLRFLLLILLVAAAQCRRLSQAGPAGTPVAAAGALPGAPPAAEAQVHRPFHFTLATGVGLALSVVVRHQ